MIIELAVIANINLTPVSQLARVSSGRSGFSRSSNRPRVSSPQQRSSSNTTNRSSSNSTPKKSNDHKGRLDNKNQFTNKDGKQVVYREDGINWFQRWFLFGWLWHNPDNDKCYDKDHSSITCEKKKDNR